MSKLVRIIRVDSPNDDAYIHYNDKRPWWRKKRMRHFIEKGHFIVIEMKEFPVDLDKLFIRYEGEGELLPLEPLCTYLGV